MSFQQIKNMERRSSPFISGRAPLGGPPGRTPGRTPISTARTLLHSGGPRADPRADGTSLVQGVQQLSIKAPHPGVKPSIVNSHHTVSTGAADLDKILMHMGVPLGSSILLEESGTTDFSSVLAKAFASQGVIHNRLDSQSPNTHVVVVSSNLAWARELPGVYKGSSKDVKRQKVMDNEQKVSVQNMISESKRSDMKIAWRYGLNDQSKKAAAGETNELYKDYNHQFDITTRLTPAAGAHELTMLQVAPYKQMLKQLEQLCIQHGDKVVRVLVPQFLHPSMYSPSMAGPESLQFIHTLRAMTRKHPKIVVMVTLALDLYPRDTALVKTMEQLMDSVCHLEPFNQDMVKFLEKAYHNQPTKVQHGLLHVYKLAHMSERGQMLVTKGEYAFKNGRKRFEVEEWGIPVEDEGEPQQTTQNVDF